MAGSSVAARGRPPSSGELRGAPIRLRNEPEAQVRDPEVIAWYGALEVASVTRDSSLQAHIARKMDTRFAPARALCAFRRMRTWITASSVPYRSRSSACTALAMSAYLDSLQQPNGLFFHGRGTPFN